MTEQIRDFGRRIRQLGYRMTPQRQQVLDVVCSQDGHLTANEIVTAVQSQSAALNRATVYRTLDFLCELQFLTRTEIGGQAVYEMAHEETHHHLVCRVCGQVQVLADHHFAELAAHLMAEHGFEAELNHLAISGVCAGCRADDASG